MLILNMAHIVSYNLRLSFRRSSVQMYMTVSHLVTNVLHHIIILWYKIISLHIVKLNI